MSQVAAYKTNHVIWTEKLIRTARTAVDIVTFASPSAVRSWAENVGIPSIAVVIGDTSKAEANKLKFPVVYAPDRGSVGGLKPWAALIHNVAEAWQHP